MNITISMSLAALSYEDLLQGQNSRYGALVTTGSIYSFTQTLKKVTSNFLSVQNF